MKQMPVEVYSRVSGYFRPIRNWNPAKRQEFKERKTLKIGGVYNEKNTYCSDVANCSNCTS